MTQLKSKNSIVMRNWRSGGIPADDEGTVNLQIGVPDSYRPHIFSLAHDSLMPCQLCIDRTFFQDT